MCGIAGWLSPLGRVAVEPLDAMREALVHRGPDGAGTWIDDRCRVGLAHRRLSIIDLSTAANQPLHAEHDGRRATVAFNGEVYNHAELRAELEAAGARFRTDHSDTEVIVVGYLVWGLERLLERLVGMFAFALFDHSNERVHLVRDRVGIKPLYFAERSGELLFASEAKALLQHPAIDAALDRASFWHYLSFRSVPAPSTLFEGVQCVGPGERLEVDLRSGSIRRREWWDPLDAEVDVPRTLEEAQETLAALLDDALRARLVADVPVGLFLSGGVDSAYLLRRMSALGSRPDTFTVSYPGHDIYDESEDAVRLSREAGGRHHAVDLEEHGYTAALDAVAWFQDEPIAAPVCASVYFLSERAHDAGVPVVLAGEGADELFIGYEKWLRLRDAEQWNRRIPDLPGRLLRRGAAGAASRGRSWLSPEVEIARRAAAGEPLFWSGSLEFGEVAKERLVGASGGRSTYEEVVRPMRERFLARRPASDVTGWMSYTDLRFRLPQLMLPRLDKMGMAFSIEGRVPFLDHRVIEFVLALPPEWRGAVGRIAKPLFKSVATRELPHEFVHRTKKGFRAPVREWKRGALGKQHVDRLDEFARRTGLFEREALARLVSHGGDRLYFSLVNFMLWHELYVEGLRQAPEPRAMQVAS